MMASRKMLTALIEANPTYRIVSHVRIDRDFPARLALDRAYLVDHLESEYTENATFVVEIDHVGQEISVGG